MDIAYYIIFAFVMLTTLPLGLRSVTYGQEGLVPYNALGGLNPKMRRAVWVLAAAITVLLVLQCVFKREDILDNFMYMRMYDMGGGAKIERQLEPSFAIITQLAPTFTALLATYAVISVGGHVFAIFRNSPNVWLSFVVYLPYFFILHDMIQIRAGVAIGIMLYAVRFIQERKIVYYALACITACFFHYSSACFIPFYFIPVKRLNKWVWSAILLVALVFALSGIQLAAMLRNIPVGFIQYYFESYMGNKLYSMAETGPTRILKVLLMVVMLFRLDHIKEIYPLAVPVMVMMIVSVLCYLLLGDVPVLQGRLGELFGAFDIFGWAMFPMISRKHYYILMAVPVFFGLYMFGSGYQLLFEL